MDRCAELLEVGAARSRRSARASASAASSSAARVADARGVVADDQHGRCPASWKARRLARGRRPAERHAGGRRIEPELDPQRACSRLARSRERGARAPRARAARRPRCAGGGKVVVHGGRGYQRARIRASRGTMRSPALRQRARPICRWKPDSREPRSVRASRLRRDAAGGAQAAPPPPALACGCWSSCSGSTCWPSSRPSTAS